MKEYIIIINSCMLLIFAIVLFYFLIKIVFTKLDLLKEWFPENMQGINTFLDIQTKFLLRGISLKYKFWMLIPIYYNLETVQDDSIKISQLKVKLRSLNKKTITVLISCIVYVFTIGKIAQYFGY